MSLKNDGEGPLAVKPVGTDIALGCVICAGYVISTPLSLRKACMSNACVCWDHTCIDTAAPVALLSRIMNAEQDSLTLNKTAARRYGHLQHSWADLWIAYM
jgi:hypothetical protein